MRISPHCLKRNMVKMSASAHLLLGFLRSVLLVRLREPKVCVYPTCPTSRKKHGLLFKPDSAQLLSGSLHLVLLVRFRETESSVYPTSSSHCLSPQYNAEVR